MIQLNKVSTQAVRVLKGLKEPGNKAFLDFLSGELEETKRKLVHADDMGHIHRLQGRAEALEDLLTAVEESAKVVKEH